MKNTESHLQIPMPIPEGAIIENFYTFFNKETKMLEVYFDIINLKKEDGDISLNAHEL